jgi:hypothetical protein
MRRLGPQPREMVTVQQMLSPLLCKVPDELPDGSHVTVLGFDHGYYTVEREGKRYKLFGGCVVWRGRQQ